jgi:hypothetical protein
LQADATGTGWRSGVSDDGEPIVIIRRGDGSEEPMRVLHDSDSAPRGDVEFVAHCRDDVKYLLSHTSGTSKPDTTRLHEIESRLRASTHAGWYAFIERDGGLGGCSIISFDPRPEADLYLNAYGEAAADSDYEFVAVAHELLPRLLEEASELAVVLPD